MSRTNECHHRATLTPDAPPHDRPSLRTRSPRRRPAAGFHKTPHHLRRPHGDEARLRPADLALRQMGALLRHRRLAREEYEDQPFVGGAAGWFGKRAAGDERRWRVEWEVFAGRQVD